MLTNIKNFLFFLDMLVEVDVYKSQTTSIAYKYRTDGAADRTSLSDFKPPPRGEIRNIYMFKR